ncbi:MmgE/PrpD family protein [Pusillimonas sp. TS35]|uniref:MmgE/PrpD family protein n=1 Tax=Paracandidimonas lactea TaxID=2895524 RepID=UPI001368C8F1|nr:MmgE/PrpD family protein [Paracandidimonas lactea]MYN11793.1 MmgE/PrpD family protein [Pusillimonas sp. TS35]
MYVSEQLARGATVLLARPLPDWVMHHAKRAVIDWYASVLPGTRNEAIRLLELAVADDLDHGRAHLVLGRRATTRAAALLNGAAAHAAELDDSFRDAMYHPGAATIAAALAAAQEAGISGRAFLRSVVIGYELSTRIGMAMGRAHYRFWHSTGTIGAFGAAAAAAAAYQLDTKSFAHALATVATFSAGLQQAFRMDSMSKPLHAGRAAEAGILAAQLARRGVTGSLDIMEGETGLGRAMSDGPSWSGIAETLGEDFHIARLTVKNHVGCGHVFPAVDGALALKRQYDVAPADIRQINIATYQPALAIACHEKPATANEARFSMKYMVATALIHGDVRLSAYSDARLSCPATRQLMGRITAAIDPEIDRKFPCERAARIVFTLTNGRCLSHHQPARKGDPEFPLSDTELEAKFGELVGGVVGDERAHRLLQTLWEMQAHQMVAWSV